MAATLALVVDEVPVTDCSGDSHQEKTQRETSRQTFLAAPRLDGAVVFLGVVVVVALDFALGADFLGVGFFTVALGFSVSAFLVGAFLVVEDLGLVIGAFMILGLVVGLVVVADLGLVVDLEAGLFCEKMRRV